MTGDTFEKLQARKKILSGNRLWPDGLRRGGWSGGLRRGGNAEVAGLRGMVTDGFL